jgi:hypothetical protein
MKSILSEGISLKFTFIAMIMAGLFAFLPVEGLQAQSTNVTVGDFYDVPSGPYTTPAIAMERIDNHITAIKPQLDNMAPHSNPYNNLLAEIDFYMGIHEALVKGETVPVSIQTGLQVLAGDTYSVLISKTRKLELKQEAIDLLRP